jgi:hypothetical protein
MCLDYAEKQSFAAGQPWYFVGGATMTDQTKRTHWLGPPKIEAGEKRNAQHERDGQIEEKAADPIAPGADGKAGTSGETEAEGHPS